MGGDLKCDHIKPQVDAPKSSTSTLSGRATNQNHEREPWVKNICGKCGAKRTDMQIGAEPSPDCGTHGKAQCGACFVCSLVGVFREVGRVLRDDGTLWLNLGDSYASGGRGGGAEGSIQQANIGSLLGAKSTDGIPNGNLVGVPWRVALALQADGWVLRQDIIWYSPNKMPESVTNRCTKSHEHIFMLVKSEGYYYDAVAIQDDLVSQPRAKEKLNGESAVDTKIRGHGSHCGYDGGKNKRDVWVVPTRGYAGAHFAVYSPQLITPCILAGTSEHGCCAVCGAPYERVVAKVGGAAAEPDAEGRDRSIDTNRNGITGSLDGVAPTRETVGWRRSCACATDEVVPCVVLDPFVGSGTTVATAIQLGRAGIGIDLSEVYLLENAIPRIEAAMAGDKIKKVTVSIAPGTALPAKNFGGT